MTVCYLYDKKKIERRVHIKTYELQSHISRQYRFSQVPSRRFFFILRSVTVFGGLIKIEEIIEKINITPYLLCFYINVNILLLPIVNYL